MKTEQEIILIELFSGTGGFAFGLEGAGFTIRKTFFSEVDKHAIANYKYNFKDATYLGSVTNVRHIIRTIRKYQQEHPNIKLFITFGSPCQDFSLAGKGKGLEGSKSSLIKYALFLIKWLRPDFFIWENVKGAYSTNDGADYWAIIQAFANLDGYRHEQQLINGSWFLPQNRERIYSVGYIAEGCGGGIFPIGESVEVYNGSGEIEEEIHSDKRLALTQQARQYSSWNGDFNKIPTNNATGFEEVNEGDTINLSNPNSKTRRGRVGKGKAQTLDTQSNQAVIVRALDTIYDNAFKSRDERVYTDYSPTIKENSNRNYTVNNIRRLTEIECERLQGFPDDWTKLGVYEDKNGIESVKVIPKTQRYKMCGNAVMTDCVKAIGIRIFKSIINP